MFPSVLKLAILYYVDHSTMIYLVDSEHENASSNSESGDSDEDVNLEVTAAGLFLQHSITIFIILY